MFKKTSNNNYMVFKRVVCDKIINRKSYAGGFFNRPYFCLERSTLWKT